MNADRLLVANRGEIARRIITTARNLGWETVAVHTPPDAAAPYVTEADYALPLQGAANYLDADALINEGLAGNGPLYGLGWKLARLIAEHEGAQAAHRAERRALHGDRRGAGRHRCGAALRGR